MKKQSTSFPLLISTICALGLVTCVLSAQQTSQTFGSGANQFTIDFTTVGNPGSAADPTTGYGYVPYTFSIGTYSISQNQVDAATSNGLQGVTAGAWSGDQPAANISWYQAGAFVNWLNTSQGYQAAYNLTYSDGIYTMALWQPEQAGYDPSNTFRNSLALYVLPSENEWYKAAYGLSDGSGYTLYATGQNTAPTAVAGGTGAGTAVYDSAGSQPSSVFAAGGLSSYGTMGQSGNVYQWEESALDGINNSPTEQRGIRGGSWDATYDGLANTYRSSGYPNYPDHTNSVIGFRVASVPEPSTYALLLLGGVASLWALRRRKG
jgi:sulfatase modifying factor 1